MSWDSGSKLRVVGINCYMGEKRRILFYYDNYCGGQSHGGTEVATSRIANALKSTGGWEVYHAFMRHQPSNPSTLYRAEIKLPNTSRGFQTALGRFIRDNKIEYVVNMGRFFRHKRLRRAIAAGATDARLLFMHHFAPGSEKVKGTYASAFRLLRLDPLKPLNWLRTPFYPLIKLPRRQSLRRIYREVYDASDAVILLSPGYVEPYRTIAGISDNKKFHAIPNIFDNTVGHPDFRKEKRVLILSRMDEIQKRISLALRIWREIERLPDLGEWGLDIVGSGHEMRGLQRLARLLGLQRVRFHGWQESAPYLECSPILMMTSLYEGLSLSMIEAATYGCVPIAFDSYASLRDVITDGVSGIAVDPAGGIDEFSHRLASLMRDGAMRAEMMANAAESAERFSSRRIAERWNEILERL